MADGANWQRPEGRCRRRVSQMSHRRTLQHAASSRAPFGDPCGCSFRQNISKGAAKTTQDGPVSFANTRLLPRFYLDRPAYPTASLASKRSTSTLVVRARPRGRLLVCACALGQPIDQRVAGLACKSRWTFVHCYKIKLLDNSKLAGRSRWRQRRTRCRRQWLRVLRRHLPRPVRRRRPSPSRCQ